MPIKFNCHKCGANLRVPEKHIGKKARCPKCDEKCVVPETSQRSQSDIGLGSEFEDIGNFLDQPAAAVPTGVPPVAAAPPMATPVAPLPMMSPPAAPVGVKSPYSSPMVNKPNRSGGGSSAGIMHPLYEARTMMKLFGWTTFVVGILACLTIFGAIFGWLYIWIGWLVKGAGEAITIGVETGDNASLHLANERLGTFFKILGVLTIIWLAIMALYFLLIICAFVIGFVGAVAGAWLHVG